MVFELHVGKIGYKRVHGLKSIFLINSSDVYQNICSSLIENVRKTKVVMRDFVVVKLLNPLYELFNDGPDHIFIKNSELVDHVSQGVVCLFSSYDKILSANL